MNIQYTNGNSALLDTIQPLWEQLNQHHSRVSPDFKEDFESNTFKNRKKKLHQRYKNGLIRIDLAYHAESLVGYCISGIHPDGVGEIESIFVAEKFRGHNVGKTLMQQALDWLEAQGVTSKVIDVAVGNERTYEFYARFGFCPRVTTLKQKNRIHNE